MSSIKSILLKYRPYSNFSIKDRSPFNKFKMQGSNVDILSSSLRESDEELVKILHREAYRQYSSIMLIASENLTSRAVLEANATIFSNKYSEGYPGNRYYSGTEFVDKLENLCISRALEAFSLDKEKWGVNVQTYSGSGANFAVYNAVLQPGDTIMGLELSSGGHLTHGHFTEKRKISASSIYFNSKPYKANKNTGIIDYDDLMETALKHKPKLIIMGASSYPRKINYSIFRKVADEVGAYLLADISHISGLVAAGVYDNPFDFADIVTTTTHKTLRGPRSALIFFRKDPQCEKISDLESKINFSVFPSLQGGPHNNTIAAVATALKQVNTPQFKEYAANLIKNTNTMAVELMKLGHKLVTDGTENHLLLWDLRPHGLSGNKMAHICDKVHITLNKNSIPGDKSALVPGGIRIGGASMTSRFLAEDDFKTIIKFMDETLKLALKIQNETGTNFSKFETAVNNSLEVKELKMRVIAFCKSFKMIGFNPNDIPESIIKEFNA